MSRLSENDYLNIYVALEFTINMHQKEIDFTDKLKVTVNKIHPKAFSEFYSKGVIKEKYKHLLHEKS